MSSSINPLYPAEGEATTASVRANFEAAKNEIEALQAATIELSQVYPIGSIYTSINATNPNTLFGFGTWEQYAEGRFLVGQESGNPKFATAEETGGLESVTLTTAEMPSHTHTQDAHTHTQNSHNHTQDSHTHTQNAHAHLYTTAGATAGANTYANLSVANRTSKGNLTDSSASQTATNQNTTATNQATTATNQNTTATNQNTGGGSAHENLPPYIVVYFWLRTL